MSAPTQHFCIVVWVKSGPRDQTNCMNGWGRRKFEIQAASFAEAVLRVIATVGHANYGGMVVSQ